MKELAWGGSRARIWLNEPPGWNYEAARIAERHLPAEGMRDERERCAAVEMLVHIGPMEMYGALGATFVSKQAEGLLVQVHVSEGQGELFHEALASQSEIAHVGFPEEYVRGLFEGVEQFEETFELGTGLLSFCWAIHGEVGSSSRFFQRISRVVIQLLCFDTYPLSNEELLEIFRKPHIAWIDLKKKPDLK